MKDTIAKRIDYLSSEGLKQVIEEQDAQIAQLTREVSESTEENRDLAKRLIAAENELEGHEFVCKDSISV